MLTIFIRLNEQFGLSFSSLFFWQKNFPLRTKSINLYNCGIFMEFLMTIVKLAMSEKMQKRVSVVVHMRVIMMQESNCCDPEESECCDA